MERQILAVKDTLDEVEVLGDELLAVVHDEDAANIELNVVALLLGLREIEERSESILHGNKNRFHSLMRKVEDGLGLKLGFD